LGNHGKKRKESQIPEPEKKKIVVERAYNQATMKKQVEMQAKKIATIQEGGNRMERKREKETWTISSTEEEATARKVG